MYWNTSVVQQNSSIGSLHNVLNQPLTVVGIGLCLFILQFSIVVAMMDTTGPYNLTGMWITVPDFAERLNDPERFLERVYTRLNGWDGQWYYHIADNGYQCPGIPESNNPFLCNVSFFPLLPALGALLSGLGFDLVYALPLVSQGSWLASILLILFFIRSITPLQPLHVLIVLSLISYPGSLYGFTSYSESVFTLLVLLISAVSYWQLNNPRTILLWVLAVACFLISLAKATGVIALCIPVLMALIHPRYGGSWFLRGQIKIYCAGIAGILGILTFLVYCEVRFDDWALYFRYVISGWSSDRGGIIFLDPLDIFRTFNWHQHFPIRVSNVILVILPGIVFVLTIALIRYRKGLYFLFVPVALTISLLFYNYGALGNSSGFQNYNIMRHMVPVVALITMLTLLLIDETRHRTLSTFLFLIFLSLISIGLYSQIQALNAFKIGSWVS